MALVINDPTAQEPQQIMVLPGARQRLVNIFFDEDEDEAELQFFFLSPLCVGNQTPRGEFGSPKCWPGSGAIPASRNVNLFN